MERAGWPRAQLCDLRNSSAKRDLYVEKLLRLEENGGVVELIENSSGALVAMEDLERIEFFELDEVKI